MFSKIAFRLKLSLISLATLCLTTSQAAACPMCKFALESDDPQPRAYMYSILFMLMMIGGLFGGVIGVLCWLSKSERAALDAAGYQHLFDNGVSQNAASPSV